MQQCIQYVYSFLRSCRQKPHLHCLNSFNWLFEGKHIADMTLCENEFDSPAVQQNERRSRLAFIWQAVKWCSAFLLILWLDIYISYIWCFLLSRFILLKFSIISMLLRWTDYSRLFRISVFTPSLRGSQHRRSVRKCRKAVKPSSTSE